MGAAAEEIRRDLDDAGVDAAALVEVDEQLDSFVNEVFSSLARKDRVATAGVCARGLLLNGERKSMQPMGDRLGVDYQRLQQFVTLRRGRSNWSGRCCA